MRLVTVEMRTRVSLLVCVVLGVDFFTILVLKLEPAIAGVFARARPKDPKGGTRGVCLSGGGGGGGGGDAQMITRASVQGKSEEKWDLP